VNLYTKTLLAVVALSNAGAARAQGLVAFLESAERQNVDARLADSAAAKATAEASQGWGSLFPSLTANGGWTHNQYDALIKVPDGTGGVQSITIVPKDQLEASLKVEVPFIDANRWLKTAAAWSSMDAQAARAASTKDQVRRQVVTAFYGYAGARSLLESAQRSLKVSEEQLVQQTARNAAGATLELELVRAKAEVERNRQAVADAEALLANSGRSLRTLSGLEPEAVPPIPEDDLHVEAPLTELEGRVEALPALKAADQDVKGAGRLASAAALALVPSVNGQFTQRFTNATSFQGETALWNAGVNFAWRLDLVSAQQVRVASAAEETARLNREKALQQAKDQVHSDWQRATAALTKVRAAQAQVAAAQRAATLTKERYGAGVATQLEQIQSDRDLFAAEVNDVQARFELASARASLRLSAGLPIEAKP
jgi:outer membrane protein TolC